MPSSKARRALQLPDDQQRAVMQRVRDRMQELDLTVAELERRSTIKHNAFYTYMRGDRPVDMEILRELERALYLPPGELLKQAGFIPAGLEDFAAEPGAVMVALEKDPRLSREQRQTLRMLYEQFITTPAPRPSPSSRRRERSA